MTSDSTVAGLVVAGLPADRLAARVLAHALIEQSQVAPSPELVGRLAEQARTVGWGEVQVVLLHCQLITQSLQAADRATIRATSDAMLGAAHATMDEILIALALAARALFVADAGYPDDSAEDASGLLARALTMLDDTMDTGGETLGLRAIEVPACYVECGQAFHRLGLWELEEDMYARATTALGAPLPPPVRVVAGFTRRALVINRLEGALARCCALLEVGQRDAARQVAARSVRPTPAERDDLPPMWAVELLAMEHFLDTVADGHRPGTARRETGDRRSGTARRDVPAELYARLETSTWNGYRACLLPAAGIRADDRGKPAAAARLAEQALSLLDDHEPSVSTLALSMAALGSKDRPAWRYARHLARLRWQTHQAALAAVRSRLAAALVLRQGEQLNRQAYADALTGLANRHAETRHLARLRRSSPEQRLLVVLIDVDHFKAVNDTFGHAAGDEVLKVVGAILQATTRASDLAVRRGGDEFMLLIDLHPEAEVPAVADGVVRAVARHRWAGLAAGLRVSVSAGQDVGAARDAEDIIEAADRNLYRAKTSGRGQAVQSVPGQGGR